MTNDLSHLRDAAVTAGRAAAELLRGRPARVAHKSAADLVTEVDLASETCIREVLASLTPGIPVQGEEGGGVAAGLRWVVDPLDGTTNFVHNYPSYCVSIGLVDGNQPLVGCIVDPLHDHVYRGARGLGAERNGEPLRVSETRDVGASLAITGFPNNRRERAGFLLAFVERVLLHTQGVRRSGSAAMDLAAISAGQADFFWEFNLHPWDTAAGALLVREAGGVVCAVSGAEWAPGDETVLATNPWLLDAVVALLSSAEPPAV